MVVGYANLVRIAEMFVPIVVLVVIGVTLTAAAKFLETTLAPWRESERDQGL
jgi:ABC-type nitrate/sulfonate/bicarbonate transport system permease component